MARDDLEELVSDEHQGKENWLTLFRAAMDTTYLGYFWPYHVVTIGIPRTLHWQKETVQFWLRKSGEVRSQDESDGWNEKNVADVTPTKLLPSGELT